MTDAPPSAGLVALADRIELWPVDRLRPYERNPRTHSEAQVDQIAASMVEFGWTNPVLVDEQGGILAGHGRLQATIAPLLRSHHTLPPGIFRDTVEMADAIIAAQTFGGRLDDPEHMLAVYRAHNEEVRRTIAPDRLLVFDVAEG